MLTPCLVTTTGDLLLVYGCVGVAATELIVKSGRNLVCGIALSCAQGDP